MIANILLTVADKTYKPGESIDKPLSKIDREFLLSGNYISLEDKNDVGSKKAVEISKDKKSESDTSKKDSKILKNGSENKVIVDTEVK